MLLEISKLGNIVAGKIKINNLAVGEYCDQEILWLKRFRSNILWSENIKIENIVFGNCN